MRRTYFRILANRVNRAYYRRNKKRISAKKKIYRNKMAKEVLQYHRDWRKKHKIMNRRQSLKQFLKHKEFLWGIKHNPCYDCGKEYPAPVMDLDHINSHSKYNVTYELGDKKLIKEIEKCQLVCSNCHRIRTWKRQNGYSLSIRNSDLFC